MFFIIIKEQNEANNIYEEILNTESKNGMPE